MRVMRERVRGKKIDREIKERGKERRGGEERERETERERERKKER